MSLPDYHKQVEVEDQMRTCPYNKSHKILNCRYAKHLEKCRLSYKGDDLMKCDFNSSHIVRKEEYQAHLAICGDKNLIIMHREKIHSMVALKKRKLEISSEDVVDSDKEEKKRCAEGSRTSVNFEEDWDDTNFTTSYNPSKRLESSNLILNVQHSTKSQREEIRKNRFQQLKQKQEVTSPKDEIEVIDLDNWNDDEKSPSPNSGGRSSSVASSVSLKSDEKYSNQEDLTNKFENLSKPAPTTPDPHSSDSNLVQRRESSIERYYKSRENEFQKSNSNKCREIQRSDSGNASISSPSSTISSSCKISSRDPRILNNYFDLDLFSSPYNTDTQQESSDESEMPTNSFIALYEKFKQRKNEENSAEKVKNSDLKENSTSMTENRGSSKEFSESSSNLNFGENFNEISLKNGENSDEKLSNINESSVSSKINENFTNFEPNSIFLRGNLSSSRESSPSFKESSLNSLNLPESTQNINKSSPFSTKNSSNLNESSSSKESSFPPRQLDKLQEKLLAMSKETPKKVENFVVEKSSKDDTKAFDDWNAGTNNQQKATKKFTKSSEIDDWSDEDVEPNTRINVRSPRKEVESYEIHSKLENLKNSQYESNNKAPQFDDWDDDESSLVTNNCMKIQSSLKTPESSSEVVENVLIFSKSSPNLSKTNENSKKALEISQNKTQIDDWDDEPVKINKKSTNDEVDECQFVLIHDDDHENEEKSQNKAGNFKNSSNIPESSQKLLENEEIFSKYDESSSKIAENNSINLKNYERYPKIPTPKKAFQNSTNTSMTLKSLSAKDDWDDDKDLQTPTKVNNSQALTTNIQIDDWDDEFTKSNERSLKDNEIFSKLKITQKTEIDDWDEDDFMGHQNILSCKSSIKNQQDFSGDSEKVQSPSNCTVEIPKSESKAQNSPKIFKSFPKYQNSTKGPKASERFLKAHQDFSNYEYISSASAKESQNFSKPSQLNDWNDEPSTSKSFLTWSVPKIQKKIDVSDPRNRNPMDYFEENEEKPSNRFDRVKIGSWKKRNFK